MSNLLTSFQRVDADYEEWAAKVNETTLNEYVEALANSLEEPSNCVQPALTGFESCAMGVSERTLCDHVEAQPNSIKVQSTGAKFIPTSN
jgi:hypothetical protein